MKPCWCCNGKGFFMQNGCSLCEAEITHYQCLLNTKPRKMTCHACDKKIKPKEIKK